VKIYTHLIINLAWLVGWLLAKLWWTYPSCGVCLMYRFGSTVSLGDGLSLY